MTEHDVLFGDVWLCSGQSNMQLTVNMIYNATEEIANAGNYPKIRVFTAALMASSVPIEELLGIDLDWSVASAHSIGGPDWTHMSAVCWLYGRMIHQALNARPIGLIGTSWGGTVIEYWMPPKALEDCDIPPNISNYAPSYSDSIQAPVLNHSNLFNSMIHPFTRMVSYGSAWYQGENNVGYNRDKHACSFSKLIFYWRQIWFNRTNGLTHIEFPFGFVQLSTHTNDSNWIGRLPSIRWHQTFDVGHVPNYVVLKVFMAVACDLRDDPNSIHPRYKHDVGYRLSQSGLAIAYGQKVEFQGPLVEKITHSDDSKLINVTYTSVSSIDIRNHYGFDVCSRFFLSFFEYKNHFLFELGLLFG